MIYQLPNGRCLFLSIEEYLSISDDELTYLAFTQTGEYLSSITPYSGIVPESNEDSEDQELDYSPENEDVNSKSPLYINDIPDDILT